MSKLAASFATLLKLYLILLIFNIVLGMYVWFPRFDWQWILLPVPESAAALFFLLLISKFRQHGVKDLHRGTEIALWIYSLLFVFLALYIGAEAFFQHIYQRSFHIAANLPLAANFFNMLFTTTIFSRQVLLILPMTLIIALLFLLSAWIFHIAARKLEKNSHRISFGFLISMIVLSLFLAPAEPAASKLAQQFEWRSSHPSRVSSVPDLDPSYSYGDFLHREDAAYNFQGIKDRNIHLFIVESYGMTVFNNSHHYARLEDFYTRQTKSLEQDGFHIFSSGYESTTFGGTSWLADATILTGIDIRTQVLYDEVVKSGSSNILHLLKKKSYATVLSAPGTNFMSSEYSAFYDYTNYMLYEDFDYEGPYFAFGRMPDQYQLFRTYSKVLKNKEREKKAYFVEYILCSSHVPWNYIPPYLDTWDGFDRGRIYYRRSLNTWYDNSWAIGSELFEGYAHSIRYSLESVFAYVRHYLDEDDIVFVIGDHQPKYPVSEKGASFAVPIHVLAKDRNMLLPFLRFGYTPGIFPETSSSFPGLKQFLHHFLYVAEGRHLQPRPINAPLPIPK